MELPSESLTERLRELESYLGFLRSIEKATTAGLPRLAGTNDLITTEQQRILYSSVYLQLYSMVEATVTRCLDFVTFATLDNNKTKPGELTERLKREWVREFARTHVELNYDNRLESALDLCNHLVDQLPVSAFKITKSGGNWDDLEIENISRRLGCDLAVPQDAFKAAKRPFRENMNALSLIKLLRNRLAHGEISFAQCGENVTVDELEQLFRLTSDYLKGVAYSFETYVETKAFMRVTTPKVAAG